MKTQTLHRKVIEKWSSLPNFLDFITTDGDSFGMSRRKIPLGRRSLTGTFPSIKGSGLRFESSLERDALTILEFDSGILEIATQPKTFRWTDESGRRRRYTPDIFALTEDYRRVWIEIKYESELDADELERIRKAFDRIAQEEPDENFETLLWTENEIRTQYLENARFLLPYRRYRHDISYQYVFRAMEIVSDLEGSGILDVATVVDLCTQSDKVDVRGRYITAIWFAMSYGWLKTDMTRHLAVDSPVFMGPVMRVEGGWDWIDERRRSPDAKPLLEWEDDDEQ